MSTVLTNGIIIPDNGSRNWGGDLANNWNIIDLNIGYMTDVKNSVTTLENSVAENTANIQINASNISALQTSKQDSLSEQQIANIADVTNKANDADVVHTSGDETVNGVKDFTSSQKMKSLIINPTDSIYKEMYGSTEGVIGPYGSGTVPPKSNINPFRFYVGKARNYASAPIVIDTSMGPTGSTSLTLRTASNESENVLDHRAIIGTSVTNNSDGTKTRSAYVQFYNTNEIRPNKNNYCDLGTSANKWKTLNGVNPGALSLPNHNSYLDIKGNLPASVSDGFWVPRCQIIPEQDGILILSFNDCSAAVVWTNSDLPSYGDYGTSICNEKRVMAFLLKGVPYDIYTNNYSQVALARLFYCQGNV